MMPQSSSSSLLLLLFSHCCKLFAHVVVPQWLLILWNFEFPRTDRKQNRFTIIRKCDIAKCGPAKITKANKCKHERQMLSTMILTKDLSLERLCSNSIFYESCNKVCFFPFVATSSFSRANRAWMLPVSPKYLHDNMMINHPRSI